MKSVTQYQDDIKALMTKAKEIEGKASSENRDPSAAELEKHGEILAEVEHLRSIVGTLQRRARLDDELQQPEGAVTRGTQPAAAKAKDKWASLGEQLLAVAKASTNRGTDPRLFTAAATGMN